MNEYHKINTNEQLDESFLNFENNILDESNMILNSRYLKANPNQNQNLIQKWIF